MKIIVCVKQVGYIYHPIAIDSPGGAIDPEKIVYMLNPYDEVAIEEALRIKENFGFEVIVITAGPPKAEAALRYAFSFGADRMIRIHCQSLDAWSISLALTAVIRNLTYDVILCGRKAMDTNEGMVGSFVAELLNISQVSGIVGLEIVSQKKKVVVEKYLGRGDREVIECNLPALFTVERSVNEPRYPTVPSRLKAEKKGIEVIELGTLGLRFDEELTLSNIRSISPPKPKPKKVFTPDSHLSASDRMRLIMSGGMAGKKSDLFEGPPETMANKIAEVLIQEKIL